MRAAEWQILSEDWGEIPLPGVTVRVRVVVTHIEHDDSEINFRTQAQVEAMAKKRGEPGDGRFREEDVVTRHGELKMERHAESVYRLADGRLLVLRYQPHTVLVTDKRNKYGEPVVGVRANTESLLIAAGALKAGPAKE